MLLTCSYFPYLGGTTTFATLQFPLQNWTTSSMPYVGGNEYNLIELDEVKTKFIHGQG